MNSPPSFSVLIAALEKKRKKRAFFLFSFRFLSFFLMGQILVSFWGKGSLFWTHPFLYLPLLLTAALGWAFWCHRRKTLDLPTLLKDLDQRFRLGDRLSTAYEYLRPERHSLFKAPLLKDAAWALAALPGKKVLPSPFSLFDLLPFGLSALFLFFPFVNLPQSLVFKETPLPLAASSEKKSDALSKSRNPEATGSREPAPGESFSALADEIRRLKDQPSKRDDLLPVLENMLREAREEKAQWARRLVQGLQGGPGSGISLPRLRPPERLPELKELTETLQNHLGRDLPDHLDQDLEGLRRALVREGLLEQALGMLRAPRKEGEAEALLALLERGGWKEETPEGKGQGPSSASPFLPFSERHRTGGIPPLVEGSGPGKEKKPEDGSDPQRGAEGPFLAGTEKGRGESYRPLSIPPVQGPVFRERGLPSETVAPPSFSFRAQPLFGKEETAWEQVIGPVRLPPQKGQEAVIHLKQIPREYREVVKNYFLSGKERKKSKAHEPRQ